MEDQTRTTTVSEGVVRAFRGVTRRHRAGRFLMTALMVLALACAATSPARTARKHQAPAKPAMPAEGVFEDCPLDTAFSACSSRLAAMKAGGVQVVVISAMGSSLTALSRYASAAHELGISIMWEIGDSNWWLQPPTSNQIGADLPQFAAACGCSQNHPLLAYVVDWLRALPGTYGYYAADDSALRPGDEASLASYVARIRQLDPKHPAMIGAYSWQNRDSHESVAGLIGQEILPVTTDPVLPTRAHTVTWDGVGLTATAAQSAADRAGKPSAFMLQAFTWGDNLRDGQVLGVCSPWDTIDSCNARLRYPSGAEQLALRNTILRRAHPALILWYSFPGTYGSAVPDTSSLYPVGTDAAARWHGLAAAIKAPPPPGAGYRRAAGARHARRSAHRKDPQQRRHRAARHRRGHRHGRR
jgi:hypothetical protein